MSQPLVSDALWAIVQPLLPPERSKPKGGRPGVSDRAALAGILFVLHTGCPWEWLPQELGCGSGVTCWRRLRAWQQAGVWHRWTISKRPTNSIGAVPAWMRPVCPPKGGRGSRPHPHRPGQAGIQAPSPGGPAWRPSRGLADRRQCP